MDKKSAKDRISKLKKEIEHHRYLYHVLDRQEISDAALDSLKKELFDLERAYPEFITPDSPTQRIGGEPLKQFKKVNHEQRMLSFNDAFSKKDMEDWLERLENYLGRKIRKEKDTFYCELKLDGLAMELIYEGGEFVQASTRGDGSIGEDVTQNLKTIDAIPLEISETKKIIIRGEVFLNTKEFNRINKEQEKRGLKLYANPRNVAAGSVRQLDPKITASRKLDFFAYSLITDLGQQRHEKEHEFLKRLGFKINSHNKAAKDLEEVFKFHEYWSKRRNKLPYEIDGVVVIANFNKDFEDAGVVGKAPRGAIAFKFAAKEATTIVEDIKIQIGRTGTLTPVAVLKPVQVAGVTISHATLHNADEIKRLDIRIGDTVIVSRAGDVIPKIINVLKDMRLHESKEFKMPNKCPVDGSKIRRDGVYYRCSNKSCGAQQKEKLYHFVSRGAFNIEGLGPKIIDKFMDEGLIGDAADIFDLKEGDIAALERFAEKSANNIVKEINEKKEISLSKFLYSIGILHVGEETARDLAQIISVSNIIELIKKFQKLSLEDLQEIPDIGPKVAQSIFDWFKDKNNLHLLEKLEKTGIRLKKDKKIKSGKLEGKSFVVTGTLESMSREKAKDLIRGLSGNVNESVSKKTDYVVVGSEPGSKYEKAKKIGIKILSEKEFINLIS